MKTKDSYTITNRYVTLSNARARGERLPLIELVFKSNADEKGGSKVYVDYKGAKDLLNNLKENIRNIDVTYRPYEYTSSYNK